MKGIILTYSLSAIISATSVSFAADTATSPYSWRGDGRGVFPAKGLVTSFSADATGKGSNILWRTALPNWGGNAPIAVKDKVFVMCQEGVDIECPQLLCLDVNTGKIFWQKPVDHLDAWPVEKAKEAKEIRRREFAHWAKYMRWWNKLYWDNAKDTWKEGVTYSKKNAAPDPLPAQVALVAEAEKDGIFRLTPMKPQGVSGGTRARWHINYSNDPTVKANFDRMLKDRIYRYPGWSTEGPFWGSVMGSVVSDGQYVYVVTALEGAACYDLDGTLRWVRDLEIPWMRMRSTPGCDIAEPYQQQMASPVLVDGKVVYYHRDGGVMLALDCATGKTLWKTEAPRVKTTGKMSFPVPIGSEGHMAPGGTPVVMRLGQTSIVVSAHGMAVQVSDGKFLGLMTVEAAKAPKGESDRYTLEQEDRKPFGASYTSWTAEGDVIYGMATRGCGAFRLGLDGDRLTCTTLWIVKEFGNIEHANLNIFKGHLYGPTVKDKGLAEIDAATGSLKGAGPWPGHWCTGWAITQDDIAIYKLQTPKSSKGIVFGIFKLPGMQKVGTGSLEEQPSPEQHERNIGMLGMNGGGTSPSGVTAFGSRIFYRSNHYLWCIGSPETK